MTFREWSGRRVAVVAAVWVVLVLAIGLPRAVDVFTTSGTDGHGGMVGVHFRPDTWIVLLAATGPALALIALWLGQRAR